MTTLIKTEDSGVESYRLQRKGRAVCLSFPPPGAPTAVDIYLHLTDEIGWVFIEGDVDIRELDLADGMPAPDEVACSNSPGNDPGGESVASEAQTSGKVAKKYQKNGWRSQFSFRQVTGA